MCVYMSWNYTVKLTVIACLVLCKTMDLYVMFCVKICSGCGFYYTSIYRKTISELRLSFLLCNYVTYRRIFGAIWIFDPFFEKNTKVIYSSRFFKKWGSEVGNEIKPILVRNQNVRLYVLKVYSKIDSHSICLVLNCLWCFVWRSVVADIARCGLYYTLIYMWATTLVFVIQLRYIYMYSLGVFSPQKWHFNIENENCLYFARILCLSCNHNKHAMTDECRTLLSFIENTCISIHDNTIHFLPHLHSV